MKKVHAMIITACAIAALVAPALAGGGGGGGGGMGGSGGSMGGSGGGMGGSGGGLGGSGGATSPSGPGGTGIDRAPAGKGFEGKGFEGKGIEGKGFEGKGFEGKGFEGKGFEGKAGEGMEDGDKGFLGRETDKLFGRELGTFKGETGKQRFEKFNKTFKLKGRDADKVREFFDEEAKELKKLYRQKRLDPKERDVREKEILLKYYNKIIVILPEDQRLRFREMRQDVLEKY